MGLESANLESYNLRKSAFYGVLFFVVTGVVTGLIPNPLYVRMVPIRWWDYLFLFTTSLLAAGFSVPQSFNRKTEFGDKDFTFVTTTLIVVSVIMAVLMLKHTSFTPARMAITMPAINGLIYLPLTIIAMLAATWTDLGSRQKILTIIATGILLLGSLYTAESLFAMINSRIRF